MPEGRFEQAVAALVLGEQAPAKLLALGEHSAVAVGADHSYALLVRYLPGLDQRIGEHLRSVAEGLKAGRLLLVLIGGGREQRPLLERAQLGWGIQRRIGALHWRDDGELWLGQRTPAEHPLVARLREAAAGDAPPAADPAELQQRLAAAVDPDADGRRELVDFARRLRARKPRVTVGLIALCTAIFALSELWGGSGYPPTLMRFGANQGELVAGGEWFRLAASIFLHGGVAHLVMNMLALWVLGGFLERLLGSARLLTLFGLAGLGGSLASAWLSDGPMSVGASGAVWGLFGAAAVLAFLPLVPLPPMLVKQLRQNTVVVLALNIAISLLPQVDLWAHLGGGLVGAAVLASGLLTRGGDLRTAPDAQSEPAAAPTGIMALAGLIGALLAGGLGWAAIEGRPWELSGPPRWQRVALDGPGIALEVPALISERQQRARDGDRYEWAIGELGRDPLLVIVQFNPGPADVAAPEVFAEQFAELRRARSEEKVEGAQRRGAIHERELGGVPTLEERFVYPSGVQLRRYSQLRPGQVITISVLLWSGGPPVWARSVEPIVESLQAAPLRARA